MHNRSAHSHTVHRVKKWSTIQNKSTVTKEDLQPLTICKCPRSLQMAPKHYTVDCSPLWRAESLKNWWLFDCLTVCLYTRRIIVPKAVFITGEKSCKSSWLRKLIDWWSACLRAVQIWVCRRCGQDMIHRVHSINVRRSAIHQQWVWYETFCTNL